jgi:LmbE family N-acetylglucosaminyl deacetylase
MKKTHSKPSIVFVVAHPDDLAIIMGGTALLLKDRYQLHVLCASKGERGYPWKGVGRLKPINPEIATIRAKEEKAACAMLGANLTFLGQIDGEIFAGREV